MSGKDVTDNGIKKMLISIVAVAVFVSVMVWIILSFVKTEPNAHEEILKGLAQEFEQTASLAHWQWQAEGRPERIMLVHFNEQGQERDRRPIMMARYGWPEVDESSEGCEALWQMLLNVPARVEGFRIVGEFFRESNNNKEVSFCRYRVSRGPHFDYDIYTGGVTFNAKN